MYILKRCIQFIFQILAISLITFVLMHLAPGSPFDRTETHVYDEALRNRLEVTYGLDKPILNQYLHYLAAIAKLDFGSSLVYRDREVVDILAEKLRFTVPLGLLTVTIVTALGTYIGYIWAFTNKAVLRVLLDVVLASGISLPPFIMSFLLIIVFSVHLRMFEVAPTIEAYRTQLKPWILPTIALCLPQAFILARYVRTIVSEEKDRDYVRTVRSKGLTESAVKAHIMRNSYLPIITICGSLAVRSMLGEIIVEQMFLIPGIGTSFITAISRRDYPIIMATTLFYATMLGLIILVVDILYVVIDPRISLRR
ncbi:MAG: ABC transporter permease [Anaerolineae bacterium]|nr:ABC transporter permease [Anaerolineae bacterium]